jgi:hypothetical protein
VAFGPTTHQDAQQFKLAGDIVEPQVSELVYNIAADALPDRLVISGASAHREHIPDEGHQCAAF